MKNKLSNLLSKGNLIFAVMLSCSSFWLTSCGDDAEGRITVNNAAPDQVTNVTSQAGPGEVTLSWTNPTSESFMYTKIAYLNPKGELKYQLISKDRPCKATITGFVDTEAVTFSFYACSVKGNHAGALEFQAAPGAPAFVEIARNVTLTPDLGGMLVNWKNTFSVPAYVVVNYCSAADAAKAGSYKFQVDKNSAGSRFVQLAYEGGFLSGEECLVSVTGEDAEGNASAPVELKVTPVKVAKLARDNWSFPGYNDASNNGTIGYSSQETIGEGGGKSPAGRVIAMLDGNLGTYWHASWKVASAYPHWFIVDMGQNQTISSVELTRRQGDSRGQKGQQFFTCSDENASDKSNPDSWGWEDQGEYSFDSNINAPQVYRLMANPTARYIKVYFGEKFKGSGAQAMVSEFNVYGAE